MTIHLDSPPAKSNNREASQKAPNQVSYLHLRFAERKEALTYLQQLPEVKNSARLYDCQPLIRRKPTASCRYEI